MSFKKITVNGKPVYINTDSICFAAYQTSILEAGQISPTDIYRVVFDNMYLDISEGELNSLIGPLTDIPDANGNN